MNQATADSPPTDLAHTRDDFPLLSRTVDGLPITYLDSASTTPKPQCVLDAVIRYYSEHTSNVHRGVHALAEETTAACERARQEVASFINAAPDEIVFTRNATEGINLVAHGLKLKPEDEVATTPLEHHSNYMPWRTHARVATVELDEDGLPRYGDIGRIVSGRTRVVAVAQVSNVAGAVAPVEEWAAVARKNGAVSLVDASQSISHMPIDVKRMGCDFLVFSGHKILGPSGIGVLYGRREKLAELSLFQTGGGMVQLHSEQAAIPREVPWRFEAGTPPIEGILGLAAAIGYLRRIGMENVQRHSNELGIRLVESLQSIRGARIVAASAPLESRIGLAAFTVPVPGLEAEGIGRLLSDRYQIMVSAGYHCAHILHHRLGLQGTVRASAQVFNTTEEIDRLMAALREIGK